MKLKLDLMKQRENNIKNERTQREQFDLEKKWLLSSSSYHSVTGCATPYYSLFFTANMDQSHEFDIVLGVNDFQKH